MTLQHFEFVPPQGLRDSTYAPTDPPSEAALRDVIQGIPDQLKNEINALYLKLNSTIDGASGADNISATPINPGGSTTTQGIMEELNDAIASAILGQIPLGSLTDEYLSNLNGQIKQRVTELTNDMISVEKRLLYADEAIAELLMQLELQGKVMSPNLNKFYTNFINNFTQSVGKIDNYLIGLRTATPLGSTSVNVTNVVGLSPGMEVTIQEGSVIENIVISSIVGKTINFKTPTVNAYTFGTLYRTLSSVSGSGLAFGKTHKVTDINKLTPVSLGSFSSVGSEIFSFSIIELDDGSFIFPNKANATTLTLRKSMDNLSTATALLFSYPAPSDIVRVVTSENISNGLYHFMISTLSHGIIFGTYNLVTNVVTTDVLASINSAYIDFKVNTLGHITVAYSLMTDATGAIKVYSKKSINNGVTWTKQNGTPGFDLIFDRPSPADGVVRGDMRIVYVTDTNPAIFMTIGNTAGTLSMNKYNSGTWDTANLGKGVIIVTNANNLPKIYGSFIKKYGSNIGRIWIHTINDSIAQRAFYSDNGGTTWSSVSGGARVVEGNMCENSSGDIFLVGKNPLVYRTCLNNSTTWSADSLIVSESNTVFSSQVCTNKNNFTVPIIVYRTSETFSYGQWQSVSQTQEVLTATVRMNIKTYQDVNQIVAFITTNKLAGFTVDGYLSVGSDEVYTPLTSTVTDMTNALEDTFVGQSVSVGKVATLKLVLTRASASDNALVTKITGGVA